MRALSARRPWAPLIAHGYKGIENRTWTTRYRGPVIIHAGKRWDPTGAELAVFLGVSGLILDPRQSPVGYLGVADLVDVHPAVDCCHPWGEQDAGIYHWVFTDQRPFSQAVPGPGRLGLYTPPEHVVAEVRA